MIDLTSTLDNNTLFPDTWKTLVRELLLKFEDGCTYHHKNIVGNRPYTVDLKICISEPVDDETCEKLHEESQREAEINKALDELMNMLIDYLDNGEDTPLELINALKEDLSVKLKK
ncbi:MAG: hypothetical protein IJH63_10480 [Methanobrevibacter sp.]|nr:hypothetical protein [Methanosphaera sp.]MBR0371126.1 hypothetical protein [Methanobrevibacter sp.]